MNIYENMKNNLRVQASEEFEENMRNDPTFKIGFQILRKLMNFRMSENINDISNYPLYDVGIVLDMIEVYVIAMKPDYESYKILIDQFFIDNNKYSRIDDSYHRIIYDHLELCKIERLEEILKEAH